MTTVIITGASRGMGAAVAVRLAEQGATVYAGVRSLDRLDDSITEAIERSLDLRPVQLDVTDDQSVDAAAAIVAEEQGHVDVVINNAAIPGTWDTPDNVGSADVATVFDTNVTGAVRITRAFLPLLRRGTDPRLVMVSSGMGSFGRQTQDPAYADIAHLPYPAAKAALNMLTVQYAKALPDVIVTAVDPGLTATEFTGGRGHTVDRGAAPIIAAATDTHGPSGRFIDADGTAPW